MKHLETSLGEKETLLKEVHHRVKNNLQIICSLLNLQAGEIADPKACQTFKESQDRVKAMAPQHPEWAGQEPFASLLKGDLKGVLAGGEAALMKIVMATHAGMRTAEFEQIVKDWIAAAQL